MKIQRFKMGFSPSVKGYYIAIIGLFFSTVLSAQYNTRWELGIALKPLSWTDEPYCFMAKRKLNKSLSLRMGLWAAYSFDKDERSFGVSYQDTLNHSFSFNYVKKDNHFVAGAILGIQVGHLYKNVLLYTATDWVSQWGYYKSDPYPISASSFNMRPDQTYQIATVVNNKFLTLGVRQSLGLQYFINNTFSISVEGGLILNWIRKHNYEGFISISTFDNTQSFGGSGVSNKIITWNFKGVLSPLTLLNFSYQF